MSTMQTLALVGSLVGSAVAHGTVSGAVIGGKYYQGYSPSFAYSDPAPVVIGWSIPEDSDNGFIAPSAYSDPDIICHKGATPAQTSAEVAAGDTVELQWTTWPESHHGPVLDYLAKCSGKCEDADKTELEFFKIDEGGLIDGSSPPGTWASDDLIANNNSWVVTIPKSVAPGNYVLRHEIIALHSAGNEDGAQNYPQCINLVITGSGSETYAGEPATEFYKADDPGILISIYETLDSYEIPGPALISDGSSGEQPTPSDTPATSSSAPATSSEPAASEPAASEPATSYSAPAASSSAAPVTSSAAPVTSSAPAPSSSAPASSPTKCTQTITVSSSSAAVTHSSVVAPVSSSSYASIPYYPSGSASSVAPVGTASATGGYSFTYVPSSTAAPISSSAGTISIPVPTSSSPASPPSYPSDGEPPADGDDEIDYEGLLAKIIKSIKALFREAGHGRDFKRA